MHRLTERQRTIRDLLAEGNHASEIAKRLGLSFAEAGREIEDLKARREAGAAPRALYPEIAARRSGFLAADGHEVYYEESGAPDGIPILYLHGGPGSGATEKHRRYFDPRAYRIILFDQRGAGRSRPRACLQNNTTRDLIADMEALRRELAVEKMLLFGGSWGATLALCYAQAHPRRVSGLILRGIFLARAKDRDWVYRDGANRLLPDHWARFVKGLKESEKKDPIAAYSRRVFGADEEARRAACWAWSRWTGALVACLSAEAGAAGEPEEAPEEALLSETSIELHYVGHDYFLAENQILDGCGGLPDIPVRIIHGRRDILCPLDSAWALHRAIRGSELEIVPDAGHRAAEAGMPAAIVRATDRFAAELQGRAK